MKKTLVSLANSPNFLIWILGVVIVFLISCGAYKLGDKRKQSPLKLNSNILITIDSSDTSQNYIPQSTHRASKVHGDTNFYNLDSLLKKIEEDSIKNAPRQRVEVYQSI